jgi:hypothetical protein
MKMNTFLKVATAAALTIGATGGMTANIAVVGGSNDDAFWNLRSPGLRGIKEGATTTHSCPASRPLTMSVC